MIVYRCFVKIALRNKLTILMYTIVFFIFAIINSLSPAMDEKGFTQTRMTIGMVDNSNSELSKSLREYLESTNATVDVVHDLDIIKEYIFLQLVDAVIIIPADFESRIVNKEKAVEIYRDDRKMESIQVEIQLNKFLNFLNVAHEDGKFYLNDIREALNKKINVELVQDKNKVKQYGADEWFRYYSNFTAYIIIATYIAVIGLVMADFTDYNVDSRRRIASIKPSQYNKEIYLGQLSLASTITLIFIIGGIILKGKHVKEINFTMYIVNTIVFSFSILCFTFLINNITRNKFVINAISTVFSLGTSFISGIMVPQQILGNNVLAIARFFPVYYFVKINDMQAGTFTDIGHEIIMQLLFGITFLLIGLYFSKNKHTT